MPRFVFFTLSQQGVYIMTIFLHTHMYVQFYSATATNTPIIFDVRISHAGAETWKYILPYLNTKALECLQNSENFKGYLKKLFHQKI